MTGFETSGRQSDPIRNGGSQKMEKVRERERMIAKNRVLNQNKNVEKEVVKWCDIYFIFVKI